MTQVLALQNPTYAPAMRVILSITNANPALVTTTIDGSTPAPHNYISNTIVRLDIPTGYGMLQADQLFGPITVTSPTQFTIPINTLTFDAFVFPANWPFTQQYAQCVPIAETSDILKAATINIL